MGASENRQYYLRRGRCPVCFGKNLVVPGKKRCAECAERQNRHQRELKESYRGDGRCSRCGAPLDDDKYKRCSKCRSYAQKYREKSNERLRKRYHDRKDAGKCVRCGLTWAEPGKTCCQKCLDKGKIEKKRYDPNGEKHRAVRDYRKANGLCIDCGRPTDGHSRCSRCKDMRNDSTRKYNIMQVIKRNAMEAIGGTNHG